MIKLSTVIWIVHFCSSYVSLCAGPTGMAVTRPAPPSRSGFTTCTMSGCSECSPASTSAPTSTPTPTSASGALSLLGLLVSSSDIIFSCVVSTYYIIIALLFTYYSSFWLWLYVWFQFSLRFCILEMFAGLFIKWVKLDTWIYYKFYHMWYDISMVRLGYYTYF